jgi:hypothetical protein
VVGTRNIEIPKDGPKSGWFYSLVWVMTSEGEPARGWVYRTACYGRTGAFDVEFKEWRYSKKGPANDPEPPKAADRLGDDAEEFLLMP